MLSKLKNLFKRKEKNQKTFKTTDKVKRTFWYKEFKLLRKKDDILSPIRYLKSLKSLTKLKFGYYLNYFIKDDEIYIRVVATNKLIKYFKFMRYDYNSNSLKFYYDEEDQGHYKVDTLKEITDIKLINELKELI